MGAILFMADVPSLRMDDMTDVPSLNVDHREKKNEISRVVCIVCVDGDVGVFGQR